MAADTPREDRSRSGQACGKKGKYMNVENKVNWNLLPEQLKTMFFSLGMGDDIAVVRDIIRFINNAVKGRDLLGESECQDSMVPLWGDILFLTLMPFDTKDDKIWLENLDGLQTVLFYMEGILDNNESESFDDHRVENETGKSTPINIAQRLPIYKAIVSLLNGETESAFTACINIGLDAVKRNTIYLLSLKGAGKVLEEHGNTESDKKHFVPYGSLDYWVEPLTMLSEFAVSLQIEPAVIKIFHEYLGMLLLMPYGENRQIRAGFIEYAAAKLTMMIEQVRKRYHEWLEAGNPDYHEEIENEFSEFREDMIPVYSRLSEAKSELVCEQARMERIRRGSGGYKEGSDLEGVYSFPLNLDNTELKKLIRENPDLPIVVFAGPNVRWIDPMDSEWLFCGRVTYRITEILNCPNDYTNEVLDDREKLWDLISDSLFPYYDMKEAEDDEIIAQADRISATYDKYWKKVIAIYADNRERYG